ncbi:hypothetical protein SpCBS45565_g08431 [Spizellomyces sp. 'palustris']|nr:hypothetical protein SpCBS45565_g08431 [Spizellomyces sp. 'palustris']
MQRILSGVKLGAARCSRLLSSVSVRSTLSYNIHVRLSTTSGHSPPPAPTRPSPFLTARNAARLGVLTACAGVMYYVTRPSSSQTAEKTPSQVHGEQLTEQQINSILKANEQSFAVDMKALFAADISDSEVGHKGVRKWTPAGKGRDPVELPVTMTPVIAYHLNQVASNQPIEDYHSEHRHRNGVILGVFDGHSGTECADVLSKYLGVYVAKAISELPACNGTPDRKQHVIQALKTAFNRMDADITNGGIDPDPSVPQSERIQAALRPAIAGSCAIVAYMEGRDLYVACTGDSRAVVGRRRVDGSFEAVPLSEDQTTANPAEHARLLEEHPHERDTVIVRGRVLGGLMPTRAFGDSRYKWPAEDQQALRIRQHRANYHTPPYVTAEPEVTHYEIDPTADKFLILATDGIWDRLSNEQSVELVAGYMQRHALVPDAPTVGASLLEEATRAGDQWSWMDDNAATHLIRNALGRGNPFMISTLLKIQPPHSRRFRDDMTANVVFFGASGPAEQVGERFTALGSVEWEAFQDVDLKRAEPKRHRLRLWVQALQSQQSTAGKTSMAASKL